MGVGLVETPDLTRSAFTRYHRADAGP
jgi:hypothetical protein